MYKIHYLRVKTRALEKFHFLKFASKSINEKRFWPKSRALRVRSRYEFSVHLHPLLKNKIVGFSKSNKSVAAGALYIALS